MWKPTSYGGNDNHIIGTIHTIDNNEIDEDRKENEDTVTALRWERQMYGELTDTRDTDMDTSEGSQPRYSDDCLPEFFLDGLKINYGETECDTNTGRESISDLTYASTSLCMVSHIICIPTIF